MNTHTHTQNWDPIYEMIDISILYHIINVIKLEVNKCGFTFSSEIRQIECTRTEF